MRGFRPAFSPRVVPAAASFVIALLVRTAVATRGPIVTPDTGGYRAAADAFRASPLSTEMSIDLPPLFPIFLAITPDERVALVLLVMLSAAIPPILAVAAGRQYGLAAAWACGILAALSPTFVMWTPYLLTDTLALFFGAVALERASAVWMMPTAGRSIHFGLAMSFATLTRAAFGAPALATLVVGVLQRRVGLVALASLAALAVTAVPAARNAIATGEFVPYRSQTLLLVWAGTTWDERGRGTGGIDIIYPDGHETWDRERRESYYSDEISKALRERPMDVAGRALRKVLWLWLPFYPDWSRAHQFVNGAYFVLAYATAAYGLIARRRHPFTSVPLAQIAAVTGIAALTIVDFDARYRLPAELALLMLSGAGVAAAAPRLIRR